MQKLKDMERWRKDIKDLWVKNWPEQYWGDDLDIRYLVIKILSGLRGKKILDIGCNVGVILGMIPSCNERWGIDYSKKLISEAKNNYRDCTFVVGDARKINLEDKKFDVILLINIIECFPNESRTVVISEARRLLKDGGMLYITTPNGKHWYYKKKGKLEKEEVTKLLNDADFSYKIKSFNPIPLPIKVISWIPGIFRFLEWLFENDFFMENGRYLYAEARKYV